MGAVGVVVLAAIAIVALMLYVAYAFRPLNFEKRQNWAILPDGMADADWVGQISGQRASSVDAARSAAQQPSSQERVADCFLVYPTVEKGKDGRLLANVYNEVFRSKVQGTLLSMKGIYDETCEIYAPYYRQTTFRALSVSSDTFMKQMKISYKDVRKAFDKFLDITDSRRPLVLAGFSQGSAMALRLCIEFADDPRFSQRFVAHYCIGWFLMDEILRDFPQVHRAQSEKDAGVVISYNSEAESARLLVDGEHSNSINPLNWRTDGTPAPASLNKGACFFDTYGRLKEEIPEFCGAYIAPDGMLKVPDVDPVQYPAKIFPEGIFHIYDFMFFYRNLQENVRVRVDAFLSDSQ